MDIADIELIEIHIEQFTNCKTTQKTKLMTPIHWISYKIIAISKYYIYLHLEFE